MPSTRFSTTARRTSSPKSQNGSEPTSPAERSISSSRTMQTKHVGSSATAWPADAAHGAVERRRSPLLARPADRRARGLLRGLCDAHERLARSLARGLRLPGRAVAPSRRRAHGASLGRPAAHRLSSPSCRTTIRSATARSASGFRSSRRRSGSALARAAAPALAANPDALHGRGMGCVDACSSTSSILPDDTDCPRRPQRAKAGVLAIRSLRRSGSGRARSRPDREENSTLLGARLG